MYDTLILALEYNKPYLRNKNTLPQYFARNHIALPKSKVLFLVLHTQFKGKKQGLKYLLHKSYLKSKYLAKCTPYYFLS